MLSVRKTGMPPSGRVQLRFSKGTGDPSRCASAGGLVEGAPGLKLGRDMSQNSQMEDDSVFVLIVSWGLHVHREDPL